VGADDEPCAIECDLHRAILIGAIRRHSRERGERRRSGMTIPVPNADGDKSSLRASGSA
jgi:hypothetical protein